MADNRRMLCRLLFMVAVFLPLCGLAERRDELDGGSVVVPNLIEVDGVARTFYLYEPEVVRQPAPLLLVIHGGGGRALNMRRHGFEAMADRLGWLVVYPESIGGNWMDGRDASRVRDRTGNADDVGFLSSLVEELIDAGRVDDSQVFATGISNGGMMSLRLACERSDLFDGVMAVGALMPRALLDTCMPGEPVAVSFVVGSEDRLIPIDGGLVAGNEQHGRVAPLDTSIELWRQINRCEGEPKAVALADISDDETMVRQSKVAGCAMPLDYVVIDGGGHRWPGEVPRLHSGRRGEVSGIATQDVRGVDLAASFFERVTPVPADYNESVMVFSMSDDGEQEISLRLARFFEQARGEVWLHVATSEGAWSLAWDGLQLPHTRATSVFDASAVYEAQRGDESVRFATDARHEGGMRARVTGRLLANPTRHPEPGAGRVPVSFNLAFSGSWPGVRSANGRWELTGAVDGWIEVDGRRTAISHQGKWHEKFGPRPTFARSFVYFAAQAEDRALLAIGSSAGAGGFFQQDGEVRQVTGLDIDPHGPSAREFVITLDDGEVLTGTARVVQEWSVPIEGRRRPGSAVLLNGDLNGMTGTLNDWESGDNDQGQR